MSDKYFIRTFPGGGLTYKEWHSFINGLYCGAIEKRGQECDKYETHYWRFGYLCGALGRYAALLFVAVVLNDSSIVI